MPIATSQPRFDQSSLHAEGGLVTANHQLAAEAGARMLAQGGSAIDAALATAFALGVIEPMMSGIAIASDGTLQSGTDPYGDAGAAGI